MAQSWALAHHWVCRAYFQVAESMEVYLLLGCFLVDKEGP